MRTRSLEAGQRNVAAQFCRSVTRHCCHGIHGPDQLRLQWALSITCGCRAIRGPEADFYWVYLSVTSRSVLGCNMLSIV